MNKEYSVLLLPGWQNSDADHWQSRWEQAHGYQRVQQHNWQQPLRGDWTVQLNEAVLAAPTAVVLVALLHFAQNARTSRIHTRP